MYDIHNQRKMWEMWGEEMIKKAKPKDLYDKKGVWGKQIYEVEDILAERDSIVKALEKVSVECSYEGESMVLMIIRELRKDDKEARKDGK